MEYTLTLEQTTGKKIYVNPVLREGIYLYPGEIRKAKLAEGCKINDSDFEKLRLEYASPRAKKRALGILVKRDKTEHEIKEKLEQSFHDTLSIQEAVQFLKKCGYLDDQTYAKDYVYSKKKRKSMRQMRLELKKKGIDEDILNLIFEEEQQVAEDVRPLVWKYAGKFKEFDRSAEQKTLAYFFRKGYAVDLIKYVLNEWKEENLKEF